MHQQDVFLVKRRKHVTIMKTKISEKIWDKLWKKCLITFIIIFIVVAIGGVFSVNYLNDVANNHHVHTDYITVKDKIYGDSALSDYYIIVDTNNKTYSIIDHGDGYGKRMFDSIIEGNDYEVVIKDPDLIDISQFSHIIKVDNDTGRN